MAKTTDELFAEATEADYETAEPVTLAASDTEEEFQFRIDEHLRTIAIPEKGVVAGVEGDLNVNIARFTMTRYYHGRDLSKLNIRINYRNANGQVNYYTVSDATVSGDSIVFSWEFAADVTQYKGNVQFVVYLFSATNAVLKQRFFTTLGTLEVLEGLEVDSSIPVSEQTDILLHLKKDLSAYAEEVKKSLPADYTAMTEQVNSLKEDLDTLNQGGLNLKDEIIGKNVTDWLDGHPEATTTVQDRSLTANKLVLGTLGYVTPEMFGAKGDGSSDDSESIELAIDYAASNNMYIKLQARSYAITRLIRIAKNVSLISNNLTSIIAKNYYGTMFWLLGNNVMRGLRIISCLDTSVDFTSKNFADDWKNRYDNGWDGIIFAWSDVQIVDCTISGSLAEGIKLVNSTDVTIRNCKIMYVDCGIITQGNTAENITVDHCFFNGHPFSEKISIYSETLNENIFIRNNIFLSDVHVNTNLILIGKGEVKNAIVSGNIAIGNAAGMIFVRNSKDVLIRDNYCCDITRFVTVQNCNGITITDNKAELLGYFAIAISDSENIEITKNEIIDSGYGHENESVGAVSLQSVENVDVSWNHFMIRKNDSKNKSALFINKTIRNLNYNQNSDANMGMFLQNATEIIDTKIYTDCKISGNFDVGIVCEKSNDIRQNVTVKITSNSKISFFGGHYSFKLAKKFLITTENEGNTIGSFSTSGVAFYAGNMIEIIFDMPFEKVNSDTLIWKETGKVNGVHRYSFYCDGTKWYEI